MISFWEPVVLFPKRETAARQPLGFPGGFGSQRTSCGPGQPGPHTLPLVAAAQQEIRFRRGSHTIRE
jgi:hypothetical protein